MEAIKGNGAWWMPTRKEATTGKGKSTGYLLVMEC